MVDLDLEGDEEVLYAQELRRYLLRLGLQYCDLALIHATRCRIYECPDFGCLKMKRFVSHARCCWRKVAGGCRLCGQLNVLSSLHAKQCLAEPCLVPFCSEAKGLDPPNVSEERYRRRRRQEWWDSHGFPTMRVGGANYSRPSFSMAHRRQPYVRSAAMPDVLSGAFAMPTLRERSVTMSDVTSGQESSGVPAVATLSVRSTTMPDVPPAQGFSDAPVMPTLQARSVAMPDVPPAQGFSDAPVMPTLQVRSAAMPDVPPAQGFSDAPVMPMLSGRSATMPEAAPAQESLGATLKITLGARSAAGPGIPSAQESSPATVVLTLRSRSGTMADVPLATNVPTLPNALAQNALQELERGLKNLRTTEK